MTDKNGVVSRPGPEKASRLGRRGQMLPLVAVLLLGVLGVAGLALDAGRGYLGRAELARAVDAAALAAGRSVRAGQAVATQQALAVAAANGLVRGGEVTVGITFGTNEFGEQTVAVSAQRPKKTFLARLLGVDKLDIAAAALAAVPPVDLALVIDQSGSLGMASAWDDLQDAATAFVAQFDDDIDQVALSSFNIRGAQRFILDQPFTAPVQAEIATMVSVTYTNTGEGLRMAYEQFQSPAARQRAQHVVVFFTDGQPTAFRGQLGGRDRVLAAWQGSRVAGYWNNPDNLSLNQNPPRPNGCRNARSCFGLTLADVHQQARQDGIDWADRIRDEGILIYTIGLGDASQPLGSILQPDLDYLRLIANEDGVANPSQPKGRLYFAPSAAELEEAFNLVAQDLLARLAG